MGVVPYKIDLEKEYDTFKQFLIERNPKMKDTIDE